MAVNKVVMNTESGEKTLIDLTSDTVTPDSLADGVTAHDASGNPIKGKMQSASVLYTPQSLTDEQKAQARLNIGALAESDIAAIKKAIVDDVLYDDYEYIQSDKTSYIKLDFIPTSKTKVEAKVVFPVTSTSPYLFGSQTSGTTGRFAYARNPAGNHVFNWGKMAKTLDAVSFTEPYTVRIDKGLCSVGTETNVAMEYEEWEGQRPLFIFALNSAGSTTGKAPSGSRIYWMKIYEDDVLVHDFVARKHLIDGFVLYDKITEKFYGNAAASGAFTGG
jgi:hypothetical protein